MIEQYKQLDIWLEATNLCAKMYRLSNNLPSRERTSLFQKIRLSSEEIPYKIAMGASSNLMKDYIRFLKESYASILSLQTFLNLSKRMDYLNNDVIEKVDDDISKLAMKIVRMIQVLEIQNTALHPAFAYQFPLYILN